MTSAIILLAAALLSGGDTFLEPVTKRDSVLVADHLRYGVVLRDVKEGTPLGLPEFKIEGEAPYEFIGGWQLDSTKVSGRKETPARYDIKASMLITPYWGGHFQLPDIPVLLDGDTLVFKASELDVTELPVDMENFTPNDIKPQVKVPYTFRELAPWIGGGILLAAVIAFAIIWIGKRRREQQEKENAEPAHIRALRKLDKLRGDKYWKPENQKAFYSGVTDAVREYMASRYQVGAMEMTTAEIFQSLKGSDIPPELFDAMKELFERADFVKFAKYTASDEENAGVLPSAVRFVTETYQKEIQEDVL